MNQPTPIHQSLQPAEPPKSLYSLRAIAIGTFFGGPLAAGLLMRRNSINLGNASQGFNALMIGILITFVAVSLAMIIPDNIDNGAIGGLLAAAYALIVYSIAYRMHGKALKDHAIENGPFYSRWRAFGIGLASGVATLAFILLLALMLDNTADFPSQQLVQQKFEQFIENENMAISYLDFSTAQVDGELQKNLRQGINLWIENLDITRDILFLEDIPDEIRELTQNLGDYCQLRIKQYNLLIKAINKGDDSYAAQLDLIHVQIEALLEAM